jgi:hypothetical protein
MRLLSRKVSRQRPATSGASKSVPRAATCPNRGAVGPQKKSVDDLGGRGIMISTWIAKLPPDRIVVRLLD